MFLHVSTEIRTITSHYSYHGKYITCTCQFVFISQCEQTPTMTSKVAVVTGSNKGIGFNVVKGLLQRYDGAVYLTSRDETKGKEAVAKLNAAGLKPEYHQLDVTSRSSVEAFRDYLKQKHGGIDILINNAAVGEAPNLPYEGCKEVIDINYYSHLTVQELLFPLVRNGGRILNISSDCGHLSNVRNPYWIERLSSEHLKVKDINEFVQWYLDSKKTGTFNPADLADHDATSYRVAKVALSALTILQQKEVAAREISVNSMHPGLVRTDMTDGSGFYTPEQAARTPIYMVLDAPASLRGAYIWHDRTVLDWYDYKADYFFKYETLVEYA